ncbi:MAG: glutamine synthetase family protein [Gammaproteobacteria bacterium]
MASDSFVARHGLWSEAQATAAGEVLKQIREADLTTIRVSFCDQHGVLRGKTITVRAFEEILYNGCGITTTLLLKDVAHKTVYPVWESGGGFDRAELTGASDFLMLPDPATFRVLPWVEKTGWVLSDCYFPDGTPVPFSTRSLYQSALSRLQEQGYAFLSGMELECNLYRINDARLTHADCGQPGTPPLVSPLAHGFQYLTETRFDELEPILEILRRDLLALGLPLRTLEAEFGPSQVELTFDPEAGLAGADHAVLARSAIKQIARRHGYLATFMCRPALANAFSSGWHLHQSLLDAKTGANRFVSADGQAPLSPEGGHYLAGLLAHAKEACLPATPTLNGYKRYRPFTLAPNHIVWGRDNRGAMLRVVGLPGSASTHIENRVGEPAANPYLYFAAQVLCGLDGIEKQTPLPEAVDTPYSDRWERLPRNLYEAIGHFRTSALFRAGWGDAFVDYYATLKEFELNRFLSEEVTDWEQREYFENL